MAIPVALGLPWLASLLGGLFTSLITFFTQYLSRRLAIVLAVLAAISVLTVAFFTAIGLLMSGLSVLMPDFMQQGAGHFWPSNGQACISAMASGHVFRFAYEWNVRAARMKAL